MAFDYFVILAEMRTGSQFLEWNLSEYKGISCHGELFHPYLQPKYADRFGLTQAERDADPRRLIGAMRAKSPGLTGFRLFHDHDPRVIDWVLTDPAVAKVVLSRNPLDSYVSLKIAEATDQWWLGDMKGQKQARISFDRAEFGAMLDATRGFRDLILRRLQTGGQTGFFLTYEEVGDVEVMNGLALWLGTAEARKTLSSRTRKQNPQPLEEKVANYPQMVAALGDIDAFDLGRHPVYEPRRGPMVPHHVAAARAPLLYMPVRGGPQRAVNEWLAAVDGVGREALHTGLNQKALRQWMKDHPGHRRFTVLRHPVARLYSVFCRQIFATGHAGFAEARATLRSSYDVPLPERDDDPSWDVPRHAAAFRAFARFAAGNLNGQTSIRIDPSWATQTALLEGMARFALPDHLFREADLETELPRLARDLGLPAPAIASVPDESPVPLAAIYDAEVETLVRTAYARDYVGLGFDDWGQAAL